MKKLALQFITGFIVICASGQAPSAIRYHDMVFSKVITGKNISYATVIPVGEKERSCKFDFYEPEGDTAGSRPLIIWMHGGGFKFGSKKTKGIPLWSSTFARRGYVCAAVNYRLSKKNTLSSFPELVKACSNAVDDVNMAIAYFKANHKHYRIDTSRIILGGNSAGGIIALQAVYSNRGEMMNLVNPDNTNILSGTYNPGKIAAVINFWGGIFSLAWLKNARVPLVSVHGKKDRIVPVDHRGAPLYGSIPIRDRADSLKIPNRLKIYDGYAHELQRHFNPLFAGKATKRRWLEAGRFAADFLWDTLFK